MEWNIDISFAVEPESESESSEGEADIDGDDALSRPTKRLRSTAARSERLGRGNPAEEDGVGTSAAPPASPATSTASGYPSSPGHHQ